MSIKSPFIFFLWSFVLISCQNKSEFDLSLLHGYWEIESIHAQGEVFYPKGPSPVVDFYKLNNTSGGFKKKLMPNFTGHYESSNDKADFTLITTGGEYYINYAFSLEPWKEKIIELNQESLILYHSEKEYHYRRHQKLSL